MKMNRRRFAQMVVLGVAGASVPAWAQGRRNLKIGRTATTSPMPVAGGARDAVPPAA